MSPTLAFILALLGGGLIGFGFARLEMNLKRKTAKFQCRSCGTEVTITPAPEKWPTCSVSGHEKQTMVMLPYAPPDKEGG